MVGPEARRPASGHPALTPSWKGWLLSRRNSSRPPRRTPAAPRVRAARRRRAGDRRPADRGQDIDALRGPGHDRTRSVPRRRHGLASLRRHGQPCDADAGPTRGAVVHDRGAGSGGFTFTGTYSFDMQFTVIAGTSVGVRRGHRRVPRRYKNGQFASFGSCGDQIATATACCTLRDRQRAAAQAQRPVDRAPGTPAPYVVTDAATGAPVAGASVGGQTTGLDGVAQVTFATRASRR